MSVIVTISGRRVDVLNPDPDQIDIADIAHGLSMICRYTGHVKRFYSVAEHSLLVSKAVRNFGGDLHIQLSALLHDATEAYVTDLARPIKHLEELREYREIENCVARAIKVRFNLKYDTSHPDIKLMDNRVAQDEIAELTQRGVSRLGLVSVVGLCPQKAKLAFLSRYRELTK